MMKFLRKLFHKLYSNEVIQLFINEEGIETYLGIINFPSFLNPVLAKKRIAIITARDFNGKEIGKKNIELEAFGSRGVSVKKIFPELNATFGTISIKLQTDKKVKKILQNTTMHFYVFFKDDKGSVALVHPQSKIWDEGEQSWESNATFDIENVKKFRLFRINPSGTSVQNSIKIFDRITKREIVEIPDSLGHLCVSKNEFYPAEQKIESGQIYIKNQVVHNSKPLVFIYFQDDSFTAIHS